MIAIKAEQLKVWRVARTPDIAEKVSACTREFTVVDCEALYFTVVVDVV